MSSRQVLLAREAHRLAVVQFQRDVAEENARHGNALDAIKRRWADILELGFKSQAEAEGWPDVSAPMIKVLSRLENPRPDSE